jgi:hypothetical protein
MQRRTIAATASVAVGLTLLLAGTSRGQPGQPTPRPAAQGGTCATVAPAPVPAAGGPAGLAALDGSTPVLVAPGQAARNLTTPAVRGAARQVARDQARGVAVIDDLQGPDQVRVTGTSGTQVLPGGGEVSSLTWTPQGGLAWAVDAHSLRLTSADGRDVRTISPPAGTVGVYAPVFTSPTRLVAVVEEAPAGAEHHPGTTTLNNLYAHDLATGTWTRLTAFTAAGTRWSSIRTPMATPSGDVLFVRVTGDAAATAVPASSLWRLHQGQARMERALPADTYLAGRLGDDLAVNQQDARQGVWRMARLKASGLVPAGCGSTLVASTAPDPDVPPVAAPAASGPIPAQAELAVAIGDFSSKAAAAAARARLADAASWTVAGHDDAPVAVRPGAWILLRRVPDGVEPTAELAKVRTAHPELKERSFVVIAGR